MGRNLSRKYALKKNYIYIYIRFRRHPSRLRASQGPSSCSKKNCSALLGLVMSQLLKSTKEKTINPFIKDKYTNLEQQDGLDN